MVATNNEIAAFENFKFNIGDVVRFRAGTASQDRKIVVTFNPVTAAYDTDTQPVGENAFVQGVVISRSLVQGNSGGVTHCYYVRGPQIDRSATFENELEHISAG